MQENRPCLVAVLSLEHDFEDYKTILVTSEEFSIGRAQANSIAIPCLSISRKHCVFRKILGDWTIEDKSTVGIEINGIKLGKGNTKKVQNRDIIQLEPNFIYSFVFNANEDSQPVKKRIKLEDENMNKDFINDMKIKFEESQNNEISHIANRIYNTQQRQSASKQLKDHLKIEYQKKLEGLECEFASEIYNLQGGNHEVESQKAALKEERDIQLATVKQEMKEKIEELMKRIRYDTDLESALKMENSLLKEKLHKEREEFLAELHRETSSKQVLLQNLEIKIKEQEERRLREREQLEEQQKIETEQLRAVKENEFKELAEQKIRREEELLQELSYIKQNLEGEVEQMELQRCQAEEQLIVEMKEMKKTNEKDKQKIKQLILEKQSIAIKMCRSQNSFELELKKLTAQVSKREVELAALASERIQKQAEQSSEVINSLQTQLEKVQSQLESVKNEKNELLAIIPEASTSAGSSKQSTLAEVGELMENELQCSICAELFVNAITLNCSHTFCKYCIDVWKRKKKECPICRTSITSECKSLVLDSFIDKMVQNLTEDMKNKRAELLKYREAEVAKMNPRAPRKAYARSRRHQNSHQRYSSRPSTSVSTLGMIPTVDLTDMNSALQYMLPEPLEANSLIEAIQMSLGGRILQDRHAFRRGRSGNTARFNEPSTSYNNEDVELIGED